MVHLSYPVATELTYELEKISHYQQPLKNCGVKWPRTSVCLFF